MDCERLNSPVLSFVDINGKPLVGGKLYIYDSGTDTPATTYRDIEGTDANENPIILNGRGECVCFLDSSKVYKVVLKDSANGIIWEQDPVVPNDLGNVSREIISQQQAINELSERIDDLNLSKMDKRSNATEGNFVSFDHDGNSEDSGYGPTDFYQEPEGGIPKTDLAQGVQDSLDLADTSLQPGALNKVVRVVEQSFTDAEKAQARANIGATSYVTWDGTDTDNKYTEIKAAYDAGRAVLLYRGDDQFSEVVSKGENQYNFMHIDKTYVELVNFAPFSVTIQKFDNYGMVEGAVTAEYNAGQIRINGMKPGMNASYTVDWATINAGGYHPTNFVINVDRPDPSKAMFFTLNVSIPYDATYLAAAGGKNMWVTVHDNVSGQDLNSYAYQPELLMNYPSGWIYPPTTSGASTSFTIVCIGGCHFVLIRWLDKQIISGFELEQTPDNSGLTGLTDNHPLGRAKFHDHSNGAETSSYYLKGYSVPFKITNFDVKSYPYVLNAGNTPAMAWRSLDVDRTIKNVTKLGIVTYDTLYNLAHISGIFRIQRGGSGFVLPLEKISDATTWTRISTTDTRLVPPDSSTYTIGRDTEIFQVGHSSPIYYYEFQFTKIDFEPGYRYFIPVATYRNYDYSYCKVLARYLHPTPITPWVELTEDTDSPGTPSLAQRTSSYVAPPIRIGFTNEQGIACVMWI